MKTIKCTSDINKIKLSDIEKASLDCNEINKLKRMKKSEVSLHEILNMCGTHVAFWALRLINGSVYEKMLEKVIETFDKPEKVMEIIVEYNFLEIGYLDIFDESKKLDEKNGYNYKEFSNTIKDSADIAETIYVATCVINSSIFADSNTNRFNVAKSTGYLKQSEINKKILLNFINSINNK